MQLLYQGKDISNSTSINRAEFIDNAGGIADSLEVIFNDPKGAWSEWNPRKNDIVSISRDGLATGIMYIDELEQQKGMFIIRALSIPQKAKNQSTQSWESVRFLEIASEITKRYGFELETYGVENNYYERVFQFEEPDFTFLAARCLLEGYLLKIANNKVIIYDESYVENLACKTIDSSLFDGPFRFISKSSKIYSSCQMTYENLKAIYTPSNPPNGPILKCSNIYFSSQAEGYRYAKNLLRAKNKHENTGMFNLKFDPGITAGSTVAVNGVGISDGRYICEQTRHDLLDSGKTNFKVRKVLEGY